MKRFSRAIIPIVFLSLGFLLFPNTALAGTDGTYGLQATAKAADLDQYGTDVPALVGNIIGTALSLVSVIFFILAVYGGFRMMLARGKDDEFSKGKDILIHAVIGLMIILASYAITSFMFNSVKPGGGGGSGASATASVDTSGGGTGSGGSDTYYTFCLSTDSFECKSATEGKCLADDISFDGDTITACEVAALAAKTNANKGKWCNTGDPDFNLCFEIGSTGSSIEDCKTPFIVYDNESACLASKSGGGAEDPPPPEDDGKKYVKRKGGAGGIGFYDGYQSSKNNIGTILGSETCMELLNKTNVPWWKIVFGTQTGYASYNYLVEMTDEEAADCS